MKIIKKLVITILRWMAVLPGAILFVLLCDFPLHWIALVHKYIPDRIIEFDNPATFEYLLYAFWNPFLLIAAVAFIAPNKKFWMGLLFTVLALLFALLVMIYSKHKDLTTYSPPEITFLINVVGCATGMGFIYSQYWLAGDKEDE